MRKVISFSLWGSDPKYCLGAVRNAELSQKIYPGWETWFYCGNSVPKEIIDELVNLRSNIIRLDQAGDWTSTYWRFNPIAHHDVDIMVSRDTDSRLSHREKYAVDEWLSSNFLFHVMRDHPAHGVPILAGMWGAKKPLLGDMVYLINSYTKINTKQSDQNFLRDVVWPRVSYTTMTHDDFFAKKPFPKKREGGEFVGQVFDENDQPNKDFEKSLLMSLQQMT